MMTRERFKENLIQAIEYKGQYVSEEDIEKFLDLNYDGSGDFDWNYSLFTMFALEVAADSFWEAAKQFNLHYVGEEEDD